MQATLRQLLTLIAILMLGACDVAGDIFQAGLWTGAVPVVGVVAVGIWALFQLFN